MDIGRQVFRRSLRMGLGYVIMGFALGILLTGTFGEVSNLVGTVPVSSGGQSLDVTSAAALKLINIPFTGMAGLIVSIPVFMLFVFDKNAGVLEYLLAVGMNQRGIFVGYLKAAVFLSLLVMVPMVVLRTVLVGSLGLDALTNAAVALATGLANVGFVTVLMTSFSSMQRKPTGMNSPLGISIGVFILLPEILLGFLLGTAMVYLDAAIAVAIMLVTAALFGSLDRLITREKLLP